MLAQLNAARATNGFERHFTKLVAVDLLIIDDFGLKPLKGSQDEDFHDVIAERYERKSTIVTSNLDIPEWTDAFPNRTLGAATIDRLRYGAYKVVLEGKSSYRSTKPVPKEPKIACQRAEKSPKKGGVKP
jgi:DNA replication protein DnaC